MRLPVSVNLVGCIFALLAVGSIGLKAAAGPPRDGLINANSGAFVRIVSARLRAQQFSIGTKAFPYRSTLVFAKRGECRLAVREAMKGSGFVPVFAADVRDVGPVNYFYEGKRYAHPPEVMMRLTRIETEALQRLGIDRQAPIVTALAASTACGETDFGLSDVRIDS
jgi:hypothetical protein